ncbi:MAG: Holliday junction resolvase RuvX [Tissierellia bacterium]|nr:Holliday junction resolvase RuvX [Tissierellia bacterium]
MKRILGLDIGDKRIGVAISDPLGITAQSLETINRIGKKKDVERIEEIINDYGVELIVSGNPINMNGTVGERSEKTVAFANYISNRTKIPVVFQDERLTTVSAESVLIEQGVRRENRKNHIDKVAATFILQAYLDTNRGSD